MLTIMGKRGVKRVELAWLAGLWGGEGSVGIAITHKPERENRPYALSAKLQMSMTCLATVEFACDVFLRAGATAYSYSFQEKDPTKHLDAHHLRVNRLGDIAIVVPLLLPFSVTKRRHLEIMLAYVKSRLTGAALDTAGRVVRGGAIPAAG